MNSPVDRRGRRTDKCSNDEGAAMVSRFLAKAMVAVVVTLPYAAPVRAQEPQLAPAFTAEQAERGQTAYRSSCQDCHGTTLDNGEFGGPPLKGGYFGGRWGNGTVAALYGFMSVAMPPDRPGLLNPQTYADLTAFILSSNGYPPGSKELPVDTNAQQMMTLKK
jgi:mono/diheme cytochrome c family protein